MTESGLLDFNITDTETPATVNPDLLNLNAVANLGHSQLKIPSDLLGPHNLIPIVCVS